MLLHSIIFLLRIFSHHYNEIWRDLCLRDLIAWIFTPYVNWNGVYDHTIITPIDITSYFTANKVSIILFSGSFNGEVIKWEWLQLNTFMYRQVFIPLKVQSCSLYVHMCRTVHLVMCICASLQALNAGQEDLMGPELVPWEARHVVNACI